MADLLVSFLPVFSASSFPYLTLDDAQAVVDEFKTDPDLRIPNESISLGPGRGCFRVRFAPDSFYASLFSGIRRAYALDVPFSFRFHIEEVCA